MALVERLPADDVPLTNVFEHATEELSEAWFESIFEMYIATPSNGIPTKLQVGYARKMFALFGLGEKKEFEFIRLQILSRKDSLPPTVLDTLYGYYLVEMKASKRFGHDTMMQMARAKNPVYRIYALSEVTEWASEKEFPSLLEAALSDEYFSPRECALTLLTPKKPLGTKEILERFLKRKIDPKLPSEFLTKEQMLNETAQAALCELNAKSK